MMKSFLQFSLFLLTLTRFSAAQTNVYHPFPDSNAVWGMISGCIAPSPCGDWEYVQTYFDGDTLMFGNSYKKVREEILLMTNNVCCPIPPTQGEGYLREDTAAKKVYWRQPWFSSDSLLYDFNLQVGDTLKGLLAYCNAVTSTVLSIDSILIDNSYRTRINFDTLDNCLWYSWIEGVGATTGLNSCFFGHFEMGTWMQCFSLNGNIGYTASCNPDTVPCGTLPVSIEDFLPGENGIHMFPNPADEKLYIQCNQRDEQFSFVLFDILGNELSHNQFSGIKFEMDISALPPGVYFMQINTETANVVVKKFSKF